MSELLITTGPGVAKVEFDANETASGASTDSSDLATLRTTSVAGVGGTGRPALNTAARRHAAARRKAHRR